MAQLPDKKIYVEIPFVEQLEEMGWEHIEGDIDVPYLSYQGFDRSINLADLRLGTFISRRYRNRRIGDFLKELNLTEGRGTGYGCQSLNYKFL